MTKKEQPSEHYVDANVAADYLNLSPLTLGRWRSEKRNLSYYTFGGAIKYDLDEIKQFARMNRVEVGGAQ